MKTKKAGVSAPAKKTKRHSRAYPKAVPLSSLKIQIGEILLSLQRPLSQNRRSELQQTFETMLEEFINQKYLRVQL